MSQIEFIEKNPITLAQLKDSIDKIQKRDGELNFRSGKTQEFINNFSSLNVEKSNKLKENLSNLEIPRLKEEHIVKIVDFLPSSTEDLEVLLQGYPITISKENLKKIISTVEEFS